MRSSDDGVLDGGDRVLEGADVRAQLEGASGELCGGAIEHTEATHWVGAGGL